MVFGKKKRLQLAKKFLNEVFPTLKSGYSFCAEVHSIHTFLNYWILYNDTPSILVCHYELQNEYKSIFTSWLKEQK